jgi:hypothetical protein
VTNLGLWLPGIANTTYSTGESVGVVSFSLPCMGLVLNGSEPRAWPFLALVPINVGMVANMSDHPNSCYRPESKSWPSAPDDKAQAHRIHIDLEAQVRTDTTLSVLAQSKPREEDLGMIHRFTCNGCPHCGFHVPRTETEAESFSGP